MKKVAGLMLCLLAGAAMAQASKAPVPGKTLKLWLDQGVRYAGMQEGCAFLNHPDGDARVLYFNCTNGQSFRLKGTIEVKGDTWCTKFEAPTTPECLTWHRLPDGSFEQHKQNGLVASKVHLLSAVPQK